MSEEEIPASAAATSAPESTNLISSPTPDTSPMIQTRVNSRQLQDNGPYAAGVFTAEVPFNPPKVSTPDMHQAQTINPQALVEDAKEAGVLVPPGLEKFADKATRKPVTWREKIGIGINSIFGRGNTN